MKKSDLLLKGAVGAGVLAVVALVIARAFFVDLYRIPQDGMYPALPAGSRILVARRPYGDVSDVERGDVVVFRRDEGGQPYNYIWRVVALPGDQVVASDRALSVNGVAVSRQEIREVNGATVFQETVGDARYEVAFSAVPQATPPSISVVVPADHVFVMGDNRYGARDSRYFGPIPFGSISGKKIWP
ncbi:Signal peptidase IB [Posidoniimonas polymericola]|uniref:Signal peptidase I n=1 Tax=Posidoniimonas polymericola TaxID=2528002 RepID=A0A5C5ZEZ8_9BACT|nr:signal peptidase I [Posidoniimonas polymericola]TWT85748.1 Signal peptidase IB [Posidoniimonas polymericola]